MGWIVILSFVLREGVTGARATLVTSAHEHTASRTGWAILETVLCLPASFRVVVLFTIDCLRRGHSLKLKGALCYEPSFTYFRSLVI